MPNNEKDPASSKHYQSSQQEPETISSMDSIIKKLPEDKSGNANQVKITTTTMKAYKKVIKENIIKAEQAQNKQEQAKKELLSRDGTFLLGAAITKFDMSIKELDQINPELFDAEDIRNLEEFRNDLQDLLAQAVRALPTTDPRAYQAKNTRAKDLESNKLKIRTKASEVIKQISSIMDQIKSFFEWCGIDIPKIPIPKIQISKTISKMSEMLKPKPLTEHEKMKRDTKRCVAVIRTVLPTLTFVFGEIFKTQNWNPKSERPPGP